MTVFAFVLINFFVSVKGWTQCESSSDQIYFDACPTQINYVIGAPYYTFFYTIVDTPNCKDSDINSYSKAVISSVSPVTAATDVFLQ
jgi:hypothetical protein